MSPQGLRGPVACVTVNRSDSHRRSGRRNPVMRVDRGRHSVPRRLVALWIAGVAACLCSVAAFAATGVTTHSTGLGGAWSGSYSGGYSGTFTIHWTQTKTILKG